MTDDDESSPTEGDDGDDGAAGDEEDADEEAAAVEKTETETFFKHTIEHRRQHRGGKNNCRGCGGAYHVFSDRALQLCNNCDRMVEAARNNASRTGGHIEVVVHQEGSGSYIKVFCPQGHLRINDFRPRQGQRLCRECSREKIAQEKERIRLEEEKEA